LAKAPAISPFQEAREMAGGRDLGPRSPRWVNGLIWSSGLGAAAWFVWSALFGDTEPTCLPPGLTVLPRVLAGAMLPLLVVVTIVEKAVRRVLE
jgi:hypothetical protein